MAKLGINYPFGEADIIPLTATGDQDVVISSSTTILDGATVEATGNRTINVTLGDGFLGDGATIFVVSKTNGTETTIFGTGMKGVTLTGVAGKTITELFMFDGTNFIAVGKQTD